MLTEAIASRADQDIGNGTTNPIKQTLGLLSLRMALAEGEGDFCSSSGLRYHLESSGATGIAPVQALPTTAASWLLYMPSAADVVAFIDELGEWLVSGTAGAGGTVLYSVLTQAQVPATLPTVSAAAIVSQNANPMSKRASKLVVAASQTLQNAPSWRPLAWMNPANTLLGQTQMINQDVRGKIIIPPGCGVGLAVISPTGTTPLFAPTGTYREYSVKCE